MNLTTSSATADRARELLLNLYFSVITFSMISYGSHQPATGWWQVIVGIESTLGALLLTLLVFVLGRRVAC
jgi:hypothetical protein